MTTSFPSGSANTAALGEVVAAFLEAETAVRRAEAHRAQVLTDAYDLALRESAKSVTGDDAAFAHRVVRAELATAALVHERTIEGRMHHSAEVVHDYPNTFALHSSGVLSTGHTRVIGDAGTIVRDPERRAQYEAEVLTIAPEMSVAQLRPHAKRIAERYADVSLDARHDEARAGRRVVIQHGTDGMSDLRLTLPTLQVKAIHDRTTRMGRALQSLEHVVDDAEHSSGPGPGPGPGPTVDSGSHSDAVPLRRAETRTMDQLRADIAADLLIEGEPSDELGGQGIGAIRAHVSVTAPVLSAFSGRMPCVDVIGPLQAAEGSGADQHSPAAGSAKASDDSAESDVFPADLLREVESVFNFSDQCDIRGLAGADGVPQLAGCGPIGLVILRQLLQSASKWAHVRVHPTEGEVISVERYRPSARMRRFLGARDQVCRFPGCTVPVTRCDLDHTVDWAHGGKTRTDSMAHLCRGHHLLRHQTPWSYTQRQGGVLEWTSPSGRVYVTKPLSGVMFRHYEPPDEEQISGEDCAPPESPAPTVNWALSEDYASEPQPF